MSNYLPDFRQGDEQTIEISMTGFDLTGFKAWFTLKKDFLDTDEQAALQCVTTAGDVSGDDPLNGKMYIVIPSSLMNTVEAGTYFYDVQIKRPDIAGEGIKTILPPWDDPMDTIQVLPQITRAVA